MNSGDKLIHNILRMEETKKFRRIKRTCIICGIVINNMTQHLQRKHSGLSDQEKIEYRAEMLRQTPIQRIGTARKNVKKAIKCPLCLMPVRRIDNHLEKAHKLKRGTANMKSLVAQAKDSGAVTATEPNSRGSEEILFDVIEIETPNEEQDGQMRGTEQPNARATKHAVFDIVKIETDDENQDSQMDQTKETPGKPTGGTDNAGEKNQVGSRKKHRIKRTCIICGEIINHMALHLRSKHGDLSDQEKTEYRAEMLRQTPIRKVHVGAARKILSSLDCPLCGLPVQRLDGHLVNAHKLERGTAKVQSLVYQAKVGARKNYKIKRTCIICGEIISRMALHLERKHPDLSDAAKMEYRAEMLRRRPIHKRGAPRKNWKSCFECPLCKLPVQRIDGHLVNAHKLKRGTAKMKSLVSQAKDRGPVTAEEQAKSRDTHKNICDQVDKGAKKSQRRIKRTCIICGEVTDEMTRHLESKHPDLSIQEKMEYRAEMRRRTPICKRGTTRENMRRTFDCPLCQFPVQRIGVHLIDMHKLIKGTAKLKSLVLQAKDGGPVTATEEPKSGDTQENISDQVDKDKGPVPAAQQPKSRDAQEMISDQVEKDTEGKQDGQVLMDQTKEFSERMRESAGGMDKAGEENQEKKLSPGKPPDSHTSILINTSTDKDGAKKFHRIKRTCIICGVVINNMTQHLQRKHSGLSNQEKIEYKAEMLRQTPIHQRRRTRENIKRSFECPLCGLPVQRIDEHLIKKHKLIRGTAKLKSLVYQAKEACRSASRTSKNSDDESRHVSCGEITEDDLHANPRLHATSHAVLEENYAILNNHSPGRQSRQKRMGRFPPTENFQHLCFVCGKLFNSKSNLANHMTVHSGKRSHQCSVCNKFFTNRYSLVNHARIHSGEKPYRCDECDGKFSTRSRLASHKMYHTGKKPHRCLLCDKAFSKQQDLKGHMEVHTGLKKFECVVCDKAFAKEGFLKVHMRIHADNKSYQCSVCKKAFTTKRYLEGHMVIHSG